MNNSYSAISKKYEKLIKDCDYEKWSQYLLNVIKEYSKGNKGLDLACGSGIITRYLSSCGYKMTGGDISMEMLSQAKLEADKCKLNIPFYQVDLNKICLPEKYNFITIINDGINYVSQKNLSKVFNKLNKTLQKDGLLIFDISSEYKLREIIGNNMFGEDSDDFTYLWFNNLQQDSVVMDISCFTKSGDSYIKSEEQHVQYIHSLEDVAKILIENNFKIVSIQGDKGEDLTNTSQRINFIAVKNG